MSDQQPKSLWRKVWSVLVWLLVTGVPTAIGYAALYPDLFEGPQPNTLRISRIDACDFGDLGEKVVRTFDRSTTYIFENGAEALRLCGVFTLQALPKDMPQKVVDAVPGCLRYDDFSDTVSMIANPEAVCQVLERENRRFICDYDRAQARTRNLETEKTVDLAALPMCTSVSAY